MYARLTPLKANLQDDDDLHKSVKKVLALAFLPPEQVQNAYENIKEEMLIEHRQLLNDFLSYFERFWMGIVTPAAFSIFGLMKRTNIISESFNSILLQRLKKKPSTVRFIH